MVRKLLILTFFLSGSVEAGLPNCSDVEDYYTSMFGALKTDMLQIDIDNPKGDLDVRLANQDYRLLGYGTIGGLEIPHIEMLPQNEICKYGIRVFSGMTDSFESSKHRIMVEQFRQYIRSYNYYLIKKIGEIK